MRKENDYLDKLFCPFCKVEVSTLIIKKSEYFIIYKCPRCKREIKLVHKTL